MSLEITGKQAFIQVQKKEADAAAMAKKTGDTYVDDKATVSKDSLALAPGLSKKSSDELNKLYETFNTDGAEGLTETEFEALFNAVMEEEAAENPTVTVKSGDTLSKIARQNNVSLAQIKELNPELFTDGKDSNGKTRSEGGNLIYPGDVIKLPGKAPATSESAKTEDAAKTDGAGGADAAEAVAKIKERTNTPEADQGTTWADYATTSKDELNFGHQKVDGELWKKDDQGDVVWADNGKQVSWNQINAMPEKQREAYFKLAGVEEVPPREEIENNPAMVEPTDEQKILLAKQTIDGAALKELSFAELDEMTPEDLQALMDQDQKTLAEVKAALDTIPADDPERADYEAKAAEFEAKFNEAYGIQDEIWVDENLDDNEARRMVSSRSPEELDQLHIGTRLGIIKALDKGYTSFAEYQAIGETAKSIARTNPEALTPAVVTQMGDDGIREFMRDLPADQLDGLPAETRGAMIKRLEQGETTPEEDKLIGELGLSIARTNPEALGADLVKSMDDNGVREFMKGASDADLAKLPAETRAAMMDELIRGYTSKEEDGMIGRLAASLAKTNPEALTPELVARMDDNGVRAMTRDMTVEDLAKLPRATLEAMRQELRAGWTTEEEYRQIDKITQALPLAN